MTDESGKRYGARYLSRTLPRVSMRPHHALYFKFYVPSLPAEGEVVIPLRLKVQADEIPAEIEEYEATLDLRIARR